MLESELDKISSYCIHIINGRHGEYDFGSYKRGFIYVRNNKIIFDYDYLLLCNDSNFGPFIPFENMFAQLTYDKATVYGCFKHLEINNLPKNNIHGLKKIDEHLQSHFLIIPQQVFLSEWFYNFIKNIKLKEKIQIINNYEIGMGKLFSDHNINMKSLYGEDNYNKPYSNPLELIKNGYPFLKKIRKDLNIEEIKSILNLIKDHYNINLIINYYCRFPDENILCNKKKLENDYSLLNTKTIIFTFLQFKNWAVCSIIKDIKYIKITLFGINIILKNKG
ncbi:hypothetical protein BRSU_2794 [Brachyspira suanatina]|uniref:Uncharacterized protein n=2 Tax=Brachyspira suanatina TaxID=381802 RepID=A0A0G4KB06_9SPIR|nr:hypothetical protein BRSU_2794 [Brachyspira suanatina]